MKRLTASSYCITRAILALPALAVFALLIGGSTSVVLGNVQPALASSNEFAGPFVTHAPDYQPIWVYAIEVDGTLRWYRKDSPASAWLGPKKVGFNWHNFIDVFPGGGNRFYGVMPNGDLSWYQHNGFNDGSDDWNGGHRVGTDWQQFSKRFSGSDGIVYAIKPDGSLLWYRHVTYKGPWTDGTWVGPKVVGSGWSQFTQVFSMGEGVIYAVKSDGTLLWYRHKGYQDGTNSWTGPKTVGSAWQQFSTLLPVGAGVILAIKPDGSMLRYKHVNYLEGLSLTGRGVRAQMTAQWEDPVVIGSGWTGFVRIFALLPQSTTDGP